MRSLDGTKAVCIKGVFYYSEAVHFKYSEAWSIYLMHIELSKAIKNADIVLIGIGNEWKYDFSKMKTKLIFFFEHRVFIFEMLYNDFFLLFTQLINILLKSCR